MFRSPLSVCHERTDESVVGIVCLVCLVCLVSEAMRSVEWPAEAPIVSRNIHAARTARTDSAESINIFVKVSWPNPANFRERTRSAYAGVTPGYTRSCLRTLPVLSVLCRLFGRAEKRADHPLDQTAENGVGHECSAAEIPAQIRCRKRLRVLTLPTSCQSFVAG
ncbi:MAG: hypothetical protein ACI92S_001922 [Planctomycetaceae bacterium]|jgi:hypothetical protein